MTTTLSIDRTILALPPLVIYGSRAAAVSGFWLPQGGLQLPRFEPRRHYAPDSKYAAGKMLLAVVLDQADLPLIIRTVGTSVANLVTKQAELEQALTQFEFPLTLNIDGASATWSGEYSWPQWVAPDAAMRADLTARATVDIPINPS